jgi:hypothetical protein
MQQTQRDLPDEPTAPPQPKITPKRKGGGGAEEKTG